MTGALSPCRSFVRWSTVRCGAVHWCAMEDLYSIWLSICAIEISERAAGCERAARCGPADSLTVTLEGELISCYSRRTPLETVRRLGLMAPHSR